MPQFYLQVMLQLLEIQWETNMVTKTSTLMAVICLLNLQVDKLVWLLDNGFKGSFMLIK